METYSLVYVWLDCENEILVVLQKFNCKLNMYHGGGITCCECNLFMYISSFLWVKYWKQSMMFRYTPHFKVVKGPFYINDMSI